MKVFVLASWISGILAVMIMILAAIALIGKFNLFGFRHVVSFFITANSFLLLSILCLLAHQNCRCNKDK